MKEAKTVSRREFLRKFPNYLIDHIHKGARACLEYNDKSEVKGVKVVKLNIEQCLAWEGSSCQHCYLACPLRDQAIKIDDQKPVIMSSLCNGCAKCVTACQTVNDPPALEMVLV
jgi:MinD superfamily P-loop ATPase